MSSPFSRSLNETYFRLSSKYNPKPILSSESIKSSLKSNLIIIVPISICVIVFFVYKKFSNSKDIKKK